MVLVIAQICSTDELCRKLFLVVSSCCRRVLFKSIIILVLLVQVDMCTWARSNGKLNCLWWKENHYCCALVGVKWAASQPDCVRAKSDMTMLWSTALPVCDGASTARLDRRPCIWTSSGLGAWSLTAGVFARRSLSAVRWLDESLKSMAMKSVCRASWRVFCTYMTHVEKDGESTVPFTTHFRPRMKYITGHEPVTLPLRCFPPPPALPVICMQLHLRLCHRTQEHVAC